MKSVAPRAENAAWLPRPPCPSPRPPPLRRRLLLELARPRPSPPVAVKRLVVACVVAACVFVASAVAAVVSVAASSVSPVDVVIAALVASAVPAAASASAVSFASVVSSGCVVRCGLDGAASAARTACLRALCGRRGQDQVRSTLVACGLRQQYRYCTWKLFYFSVQKKRGIKNRGKGKEIGGCFLYCWKIPRETEEDTQQ